jgi:hypothetical protein
LLTVKNLADSYALAWSQARSRRAERQYLLPLGMDTASFAGKVQMLGEKLGGDVARELLTYPMPDAAAIFMGVDSSAGYLRAHLYTVEAGRLTCHNDTGFAAIGVGVYQAASSLMFSGHGSETGLDTAVYLTYAAKKRAEVAPGVGIETDMVYVSNTEPKYFLFGAHVITKLEEIYQQAEKSHKRINRKAEEQCHAYLDTLRTAPAQSASDEPTVELAGTPPAEPSSAIPGSGADKSADIADVQPVGGGN